jgi:hypothetical protein
LLRSRQPTLRNGSIFYYEIHLKGDREAVVRRFQWATSQKRREQVNFILTHEGLAKLVRDLAETGKAQNESP